MSRKAVGIREVDSNLWTEVKMHCILNKLNIAQYLEKIISKDLNVYQSIETIF